MAANLLAALEQAPAATRAIYWAHNSHVAAAETRWGPTGALLRRALGCGYRALATTFGRGAFIAQAAGDPSHSLAETVLGPAAEESVEAMLGSVGRGARIASWRCGGDAPPPWLGESRPLRWIGAVHAAGSAPSAGYRPYRLTEAFDGIAYLPEVSAEPRR